MAAPFRSFLTRLTGAPAQPEIEAIARNLEHLLNTRKRCGSVVAELGLGDYEKARTFQQAVTQLRAEIEQLVRRYEPRLASPKVTLRTPLGSVDPRTLRFELQGQAGAETRVLWLDIDTTTRHFVVTIEGTP